MAKKDCLIVGYNELPFRVYEKKLLIMGENSGTYQNFNLDFIRQENTPYTVMELFNKVINNRQGPQINSFNNFMNLAIVLIGSHLHRSDITFDYINLFDKTDPSVIKMLQTNQYKTIAITTSFYVTLLPVKEVVSFIRQLQPEAKIILGGPFITNIFTVNEQATLTILLNKLGADVYINHTQGEQILSEVIAAMKNHSSLNKIVNIAYYEDLEIKITASEQSILSLKDNLPDWNLFTEKPRSCLTVRTALSCPFTCGYCDYPARGGKYQQLSLEEVEHELDKIYSIGGKKYLSFIDDTFNIPVSRFKSILKLMLKKNYGFKWFSFLRCQYVDEETVALMKETNCLGVMIGVESGNQQMLDIMHKEVQITEMVRGLELLKKYEIPISTSFLVGFPGETKQSLGDTVSLIEYIKPEFYRMQVWYASTLAPIFQQREKYRIQGLGFEWSHATMNAKEAFSEVKKIFFEIKNALMLPRFGFDYPGVITLLSYGYSFDTITEYIRFFNSCIKVKLKTGEQVRNEDIELMRKKIQVPKRAGSSKVLLNL